MIHKKIGLLKHSHKIVVCAWHIREKALFTTVVIVLVGYLCVNALNGQLSQLARPAETTE